LFFTFTYRGYIILAAENCRMSLGLEYEAYIQYLFREIFIICKEMMEAFHPQIKSVISEAGTIVKRVIFKLSLNLEKVIILEIH